jgi:hypothetical protein
VDVEDEVLVIGREEKVLAAAPGTGEAEALERGEGRLERLQRGDVRRPGLLDRGGADRLVERLPPGLDLGKLGNSSSSWTRSG